MRKNYKETRNSQEDRTSGTLVAKENNGWNREVQNGKGQGLKSKNDDANVLGGGRRGRELRNSGRKGEQSKESGGAERKRTRNESQE